MRAAPEVISARTHYDGTKADIWSCGVMLYVMLFCEYPFERPEDEADKYGFQKVRRRLCLLSNVGCSIALYCLAAVVNNNSCAVHIRQAGVLVSSSEAV